MAQAILMMASRTSKKIIGLQSSDLVYLGDLTLQCLESACSIKITYSTSSNRENDSFLFCFIVCHNKHGHSSL